MQVLSVEMIPITQRACSFERMSFPAEVAVQSVPTSPGATDYRLPDAEMRDLEASRGLQGAGQALVLGLVGWLLIFAVVVFTH